MVKENFTMYMHSLLVYYGNNFAFIFLGVLSWLIILSLFIFWKSLLISYLRKDEKFNRGYYYLYIKYKSYIKNVSFFSIIGLFIVGFTLCLKESKFIHFLGIIIIFSLYSLYCFRHYYIKDNIFDLFEDYIWIYKQFISLKKENIKLKTS